MVRVWRLRVWKDQKEMRRMKSGPSWKILHRSVQLISEQMDVIKNQERIIKYYKKREKNFLIELEKLGWNNGK